MIRPVRFGVAAAMVGVLLAAGCGSSDEGSSSDTTAASTTSTTADTFVADLNELCATGRTTTDAASADFQAALADLQTADSAGDQAAYATALDQAETAMETILGAIDDFTAAVDELDVPADAQAALTDYVDAMNQERGFAQDARDAIAADDGQAFTEATDAISANSDAIDATRADAAAQLGADECAPDDATGTTDTTTGDTTETTAA